MQDRAEKECQQISSIFLSDVQACGLEKDQGNWQKAPMANSNTNHILVMVLESPPTIETLLPYKAHLAVRVACNGDTSDDTWTIPVSKAQLVTFIQPRPTRIGSREMLHKANPF